MSLSKHPLSWLLHFSLAVIAIGGMVTWLFGQRGSMTIQPGQRVDRMATAEGISVSIPIEVILDSFVIDYYPGGVAPRDFSSYLRVDGKPCKVSMNKIVEVEGYRLYQSSYTPDGGTILSVNHDPWGIGITYVGYALFVVAAVALLFAPKGRFRRLLRGMSVAVLLLSPMFMSARSVPILPRAEADSLARKQVIYGNRVAPFGTLARDFIVKLSGKDHYGDFTPEQVIGGWFIEPEGWQDERMILVKNSELRQRLGMGHRKYASFAELFDKDGYRLQRMYGGGTGSLDNDILEVDEKVGLVMSLLEGKLIVPRPDDVAPLPQWKVDMELWYNHLSSSRWPFVLCLVVGFAALAYYVIGRRLRWLDAVIVSVLLLMTLYEAMLFSMRWIVAGHIPLSNGYETMQFLAVAVLLIALWLWRRVRLMGAVGLLLSGFVMLVAYLANLDPQVSALMPVLVSPWLSIHVSVVMGAYALLAFTFAVSIIGVFSVKQRDKMRMVNQILLYPSMTLLGIGIILGAVWANVSWGRYWAWDPKETWALITFIVYAVPFHARYFRLLRDARWFHAYMLLAFAAVVMTYFGVNYLGGMHAYAS